MGKKHNYCDEDTILDTPEGNEIMNKWLNCLEAYVNEVGRSFFIVGMTKKEEEKDKKTILKMIKKLRKGEIEKSKVFDMDVVEEYINDDMTERRDRYNY